MIQVDVTFEPPDHTLIVAETVTMSKDGISSPNQSITPDVHTDFSFFVSHASGVFYVSLEPWIRKLETELSEPQSEGADFRLKRLLESGSSVVEQPISRQPSDSARTVTSSAVIEDGNVGYLLLTTVDNEPQAVILDAPEDGMPTEEELAQYMEVAGPSREIREPWQPPKELWESFDLRGSLDIPNRHKASLKEEIRLSPASLEVLMSAHRVLAAHTDKLQHAVSDLFNRCQRLQDEYRDQIYRAAQLVPKIDAVTGNDDDDAGSGSEANGSVQIEERLDKVKTRQDELNSRYQSLRRKMASIGGTELSDKEAALIEEFQTMEGSLDRTKRTLTDDIDGSEVPAWQRLEKVKDMKKTLAREIGEISRAGSEERAVAGVKVPSHSRKQENEQIQKMLQHQNDLLEATSNRLRSFGISIPSASLEGGS